MVSFRVALLFGVVMGAACASGAGRAHADPRFLALVPMPREVTPRPGTARLGPDWTLCLTNAAEDTIAARQLAEEAALCFRWTWQVAAAGARAHTIELRAITPPVRGPALFAEQGYRLVVSRERVVIEAATPTGRFYGVQTFRQLLRAHPDGVIPCVRIEDSPALAWRGISDDISRGQVSTLEDFKAIIRQLAYYKINLYQLYIEDMFRFEGSPASGRDRGALTKGDLEQLVAEGQRQHVVVSPIFESLAHQERMLSLKEHRSLAEGGADDLAGAPPSNAWQALVRSVRGVFGKLVLPSSVDTAAPAAFSARNPHALRFVQSLVDSIAEVTRGPFFHIGGDEWKPPVAPAGTATLAAEDGVRDYGRYLGQVANHLRARFGCRAMVYGDVILGLPEAARDLPRNVIVVDWHYDPQDTYPSLLALREQGFRDVMVSPGLWTWRTFYPNYASGFRSIASFAQAGKRDSAMGCITAAWGDGGAENLRENNWAGYAFSAAASWETGAPDPGTFLRRFVIAQYGSDAPQLGRAEALLGWQEFDRVACAGQLFHRPPLVRPRPPQFAERMGQLEIDMREVEKDLDAAAPTIRFDRDHLAALRHCANRYLYISQRERFLDATGRTLDGRGFDRLPAAERAHIARGFDRLARTATALKDGFRPLWLGHNRPEGLDLNEARLERQAAMLRALGDLARRGVLKVDDSYSHMQALSAVPVEAALEDSRP